VYLDDVWFHVQGAYSSTSQGPPFPDASLKRHPVAGYMRAHGLLQNQFLLQVCAAAMSGTSVVTVLARCSWRCLRICVLAKTREIPRQCFADPGQTGCGSFSCWFEVGSSAGCKSGRSAGCCSPLQTTSVTTHLARDVYHLPVRLPNRLN
jgi:hypothetical protein